MKKILALTILLLTASFLYGEVKVPRYVYGIADLEKAKVEAKKKAKNLAFVYTDPGST